MGSFDVQTIIEQVEQLLAEEELSPRVELAIQKLLNVVEALSADKQSLADEVDRLRKKLEQKKKAKTTSNRDGDDKDNQDSKSDHSSEKRRKGDKPKTKPAKDRRSFKDLTIHETIECPVDPSTLPPDAVRLDDEIVIVQDIEIKPKNTKCQRQVFYSEAEKKFYRGPLPAGYQQGDFSANLRSLIVALKYCGSTSEPKISEFLENFDVQVSAGSISNILTNSADDFEPDYHDVLVAGLSSTTYQQTDDTILFLGRPEIDRMGTMKFAWLLAAAVGALGTSWYGRSQTPLRPLQIRSLRWVVFLRKSTSKARNVGRFSILAHNSYVTLQAARNLDIKNLHAARSMSLGGTTHNVKQACLVFAQLAGHQLEFQANVVDKIGKDADGREIDVLFGALAMQLWNIKLDLPNERLDLSHFADDFVEF